MKNSLIYKGLIKDMDIPVFVATNELGVPINTIYIPGMIYICSDKAWKEEVDKTRINIDEKIIY